MFACIQAIGTAIPRVAVERMIEQRPKRCLRGVALNASASRRTFIEWWLFSRAQSGRRFVRQGDRVPAVARRISNAAGPAEKAPRERRGRGTAAKACLGSRTPRGTQWAYRRPGGPVDVERCRCSGGLTQFVSLYPVSIDSAIVRAAGSPATGPSRLSASAPRRARCRAAESSPVARRLAGR